MRSIICFFLFLQVAEALQSARNVKVAPDDGTIIATQVSGGLLVKDRDLDDSVDGTEVQLPSGIEAFDDISIPPDGKLVFALSSQSRAICSYSKSGLVLTLIGCRFGDFAVSPFTGVSARDGVVVISGGVGGFTVYDYNTNSGEISTSPRINRHQMSNVVGFPNVELLPGGTLAAFSTDYDGRSSFGTKIVDLSQDPPRDVRNFFVSNTIGFTFAEAVTNFPFVNAFYEARDGTTYMYTANGAMTVQNPYETTITIIPSPTSDSFKAVSTAVDAPNGELVVAGLDRGKSVVLQFDLSSPLSPEFLSSTTVEGRISSIGAHDGVIAYVGTDFDEIKTIPSSNGGPTSPPVAAIPEGLCFSPMAVVEGPNGEHIRMKDLKLGQKIKTSGGVFDTVFGWVHIDRSLTIEYLKIVLESQEAALEVSRDHLLYTQRSPVPVAAGKIVVGDILAPSNVVARIETIKRQGLFAPLTISSTLLVNGVEASSYATIDRYLDSYIHIGSWATPFTYHGIGHIWFAPYRIACTRFPSLCSKEETPYPSQFLEWSIRDLSIIQLFKSGPAALQAVTFVSFVPFLVTMILLEGFLSHLREILILFAIALLMIRRYHRHQKVKGE